MREHFQSVVIPVSAVGSKFDHVGLSSFCENTFSDFEVIYLVDIQSEESKHLVDLVGSGSLKNSRALFTVTKSGQSDFVKALVGAFTAIGDRVAILLDFPEDLDELDQIWLSGKKGESADCVFVSPERPRKSKTWSLFSRLFGSLYKSSTGFDVAASDFEIVDMSRKFVGVLQRGSVPEATLRSAPSMMGIESVQIKMSFGPGRRRFRFGQQFTRSLETLWSASVKPLRMVSIFSLLAAGLNLLYTFYVLGVSLTQEVERGWTSMSLQISGMFLITLLVLAAIVEFLIFMQKSLNRDPDSLIIGEVNSPDNSFTKSVNVAQGKK